VLSRRPARPQPLYLAVLRLGLRMPAEPDPTERRRLIRAMLDTLHRHFNVAVAEAGVDDPTGSAWLGAAALSASRREARATLERVADAVAGHPRVELLSRTIRES